MKLTEKLRIYDKNDLFESYIRIVRHYKTYNSVTKNKMLDEICNTYEDVDNIIDICMVRELKFLEKLLNQEEDCQDREKYSFEIHNLERKCLLFSYPEVVIPEELCDKVKLALKKVDWEKAKENDRRNELLVGICKVFGSVMAQFLVEMGTSLLGISKKSLEEHLGCNGVFNYYVYFHVDRNDTLGIELPVFIYQNYYNLLEELEEARKKFSFGTLKKFCKEDYINIFYYDFNINQKDVKKFYDKLIKCEHYEVMKAFIVETSVLNGDRELLKFFLQNFVKDEEFFKLLNLALDEMPSAALNGATPNDVKYNRLEEERNRYQKEVQYMKQGNAKISKKEVKTFYQIYFALLEFTNNKYQVNPRMKKIYKQTGIDPNELIDIIEKFWEKKESIIDEFLEKNPYKFGSYEQNLVEDMKRGIRGYFVLAKYEQEYTCLLDQESKCYMIKGINDNLDNIISYRNLPCFIKVSLVPFNGKIIYDGVFQIFSEISMGAKLESLINSDLESSEKVYKL